MKHFIVVFLALVLLAACRRDDPTPNGNSSFRPIIRNNTIYTAKGTPIRGAFIAMDYDFPNDRMITATDIAALKQNGLNALHVYVENNYTGRPVGYQSERCDFVVEESGRQGLYVIITIGVINYEGVFREEDIQFVMDFWEFYAERYKDKEHVIFEICNEMPYVEGLTPRIQADAFRIIRKHSPDAMVLFYSLPGTNEIEYILNTALPALEQEIEGGLDWDNEAFAFHGYEGNETSLGPAHFRRVIRDLKQAGYPTINTEVPNRYEHTIYTDVNLLGILEEEGISWTCFTEYIRIPRRSIWRGRLEAVPIVWEPDFGDWPTTNAVFPFSEYRANQYVGNATAKPVDGGAYSFDDKDFISYKNLYFGERNPLSFTIDVKSESGGNLYLRRGDERGEIVGQCSIPESAAYVLCSGYVGHYLHGLNDIVLTYEGEKPLYLRSWKFDLPELESYTNPYQTVYACQFPYATTTVKRAVSTDTGSAAPMQVEGITDGSELLFDFVLLDNEDMTFHVRAMPLGGGTIEIHWGDFSGIESEIGICEISGTPGEWSDFSIPLRLHEVLQINGNPSYWDLKLLFRGAGTGELFKISEFRIGESRR